MPKKFNGWFLRAVKDRFDPFSIECRTESYPDSKRLIGYTIHLQNFWIVSIIFGPGSYTENRYTWRENEERPNTRNAYINTTHTAELSVFSPDGQWYRLKDWNDDFKGHLTVDAVMFFIALINRK